MARRPALPVTALHGAALVGLLLALTACADGSPAVTEGSAGAASSSGGSGGASGGNGKAGGASASGGSGATSGGAAAGGAAGDDGVPGGEAGDGGSTLPYANVTAVTVSGSDGAYTFAVSVESSDIDCSQYANWWEVLREDGTLVYRRILEHSHTDENGTSDADAPGNTFTRSGGPIAVGASESVLVRAHLSTGGYRGIVMRGYPSSLFEQALDLREGFAPDVESEPPQPTTCQF